MPRKKPQPSGRWLSDDEIREMADSSQRDIQIQYLRERGVPFTLSRLGRPLVLVSEIEGRSQPAKISDPLMEPFGGMPPITWLHQRMPQFMIRRGEIIARSFLYSLDCGIDDSGVYFLIKDSQIMYVGISKQINARLIQHKKDRKPFNRIFCIKLPELVMSHVECIYIHALNPPWNNDMPILYHNMEQYVSACSPEKPEVTQ